MIWRCNSAAVSVWVDKIMCCWWRPEFAVQQKKRPQGAQSHADRHVRSDAQADAWGLGEPQQASRNIPKGYSGSLLAYVIGDSKN